MIYNGESHESRRFSFGDSDSRTLRIFVDDTYDEDEVEEEARARTPLTYRGLYRQSIECTPTGDCWEVDATYGPRQSRDPWTHEWSLKIGSEQVHQTHSLATVGAYVPSGGTVTPTYNAIGISEDDAGNLHVDGVDNEVSTFDWNETLYLPRACWTRLYTMNLYAQRGRVAAHAFRGPGNVPMASGECYLGSVSAEPEGDRYVAIHFEFRASPNAILTIGGISGIEKYGWDYVWVWWRNVLESGSEVLTKKPKQVNVERLKLPGNFLTFGLPGSF
jgi:hypothetical protein